MVTVPAPEGPDPVTGIVTAAARAQPPSRLALGLATIAIAVAILVVGFVFSDGDGDVADTSVASSGDVPETVAQTPLERACTREIARLTSGIEAWDGIENWAATRDGQPALDRLAANSLLALARVDGLEAGAASALGALDQAMAAARDLSRAQAAPARASAVRDAGRATLDLVDGHPSGAGCDLARLRRQLDP